MKKRIVLLDGQEDRRTILWNEVPINVGGPAGIGKEGRAAAFCACPAQVLSQLADK